MDDFFGNEDPNLDKMEFEEFLHWLYENREMFDDLEEFGEEIQDDDFTEYPEYNYNSERSIRQNVVADRYGPFLCYRN